VRRLRAPVRVAAEVGPGLGAGGLLLGALPAPGTGRRAGAGGRRPAPGPAPVTGGRDPGAATPTYYHRVAPPRPARPALEGGAEAETCVVGGGLAGLGVALSLAERGLGPGVLVLEAGRVGDGASGRNGGMASSGFARDAPSLARAVGPGRARAMVRLSVEAGLRLVRERVARHAIPCGLAPGVVVASWFDDPAGLRAEAERHNAEHGTRLEFWPRERLRDLYRSPRYFDGVLDPDGFHLDPLALCEGYAAAAEALGASVREGTPALGLARERGGGFLVRTPRGRVRARRVVLCQSAYAAPALHPGLARATLPLLTHVVVTEPLGALAGETVRGPHAVYDDRFATGYYRLLPGGRLLWGGRVSLREPAPAALPGLMRRDLALVYPRLAGVAIEQAWSGRMGFARHKMPVLRELEPGLWAATLFGGHGLNTTTMAGELLARAVAEGDPAWRLLDPFGPAWAGGPLGRAAAGALLRAHAARDAWRAARDRRRAAAGAGGRP
jgi:gamma-glutamylputrescine oxidase